MNFSISFPKISNSSLTMVIGQVIWISPILRVKNPQVVVIDKQVDLKGNDSRSAIQQQIY